MISEAKPGESATAEHTGDASGKTKEALTAILFISPKKWHYQAPAIDTTKHQLRIRLISYNVLNKGFSLRSSWVWFKH